MKKSAIILFSWMVMYITCSYATDVTITSRVPVQHINTSGQIDGATMSTVGNKYLFQRLVAGKVYLADPQGGSLLIDLAATDYQPPVVAPPSPPPAPVVRMEKPVTPVRRETIHQPLTLTDDAGMVDKVNHALGLPLFSKDKSLWDEDAETVGQRLGWTADSVTSYRKYDERPALNMHMLEDIQANSTDDTNNLAPKAAVEDPSVTVDLLGQPLANCLGSHAYCATLYTRHGKPDFLSLIFANNGDIALAAKDINFTQTETTPIIARDAKYLQRLLTQTFGDFSESGFGASTIRAPAKRWDWNGTSVLLIHSVGHYVGVIICPTDFADGHGVRPDRDSNALKANLVNNLKRSDNGDVYIENIPYVDQGRKGYCVPATWERNLRYLDIPSDMYFFATAGGTGFGGGTSTGEIRQALYAYLDSYQTHINNIGTKIDMPTVIKYVDQGRPLMWSCWYTQDIDEFAMFPRDHLRNAKTWDIYQQQLKLDIAKLQYITVENKDNGHMRLIIGYNSKTNEVAVSDSWNLGKFFWMSIAEAQAEDMLDTTVLE
jgi:hypothetical protein